MMRPAVTSTTMRRLEGSLRKRWNLCFAQQQQQQQLQRGLSSVSQQKSEKEETDSNRQPFVKSILEPGEWDVDRKDPYHRPKPPRNKLISAEDFANRPPVGFDNEFSTYEDSMIALSWLDTKTCQQIYSTYVNLMIRHERDHPGRTSHEYVCRVLAQRFQISTWRAAGIVQLQHAEEQMRQNNPELICEEQAQWAEESIMKNIADAYKSERSYPPNRGHGGQQQPFVEDPVGIHGLGEPDEISNSWVATDDIYDMEAKLQQANARDDELAQVMIDEHVYKEDVDESTLLVQTDGVAKRLIKAQEEQQAKSSNHASESPIEYPETNGQGVKRPRWKYVAKVVNTRAMRRKGRKNTSYTNNNTYNTLVEEDGKLRVATVEEAKKVAWKPTRTKGNEYIYEGAQKAWLEKTIHGKSDVWGKAPPTSAAAATAAAVGRPPKKEAEPAVSEAETEEDVTTAPEETDANNNNNNEEEEDSKQKEESKKEE